MRAAIALIRREFLAQVSLWRTFMIIALGVAVVMFTILGAWPYRNSIQMYQVRSTAEILGIVLFIVFGCGSALLVTVTAALSIAEERERDTYTLLRLTPIRPWALFLGKVSSPFGAFLLLFCALLPCAALSLMLMGVDWSTFLTVIGFVLLSTATLAAIGFAASCRSHTSRKAIVVALAEAAVFLFLPFLMLGALVFLNDVMRIRLLGYRGDEFVIFMSPPFAPIASQVRGGSGLPVQSIVYQLVWLTQATLRAIWYARRARFGPSQAKSQRQNWRELWRPRRQYRPIMDRRNPIWIRMYRHELRGYRTWGKVLGTLILIGYSMFVWSIFTNSYRLDEDDVIGLTLSILIPACIIAPAYIAALFTKEHESDTIRMMRLTLLHPHTQVLAQLRAAVHVFKYPLLGAAVPVAVGIVWILMYTFDEPVLVGALCAPVSLFVCLLFTIALTCFVATATRRTVTTIVIVYMAAVIGHLLLVLVIVFCEMAHWRGVEEDVFSLVPWGAFAMFFSDIDTERFTVWAVIHGVYLSISFTLIALSIQQTGRKSIR